MVLESPYSFGCIELSVFGDAACEILLSVLATQPINMSVLLCLF